MESLCWSQNRAAAAGTASVSRNSSVAVLSDPSRFSRSGRTESSIARIVRPGPANGEYGSPSSETLGVAPRDSERWRSDGEFFVIESVAEASAGATVVFAEDDAARAKAPLIVRKSDGGFLYATTDLAAVAFRAQELGADRVLYVTDAGQGPHFAAVFAAARRAGLVGRRFAAAVLDRAAERAHGAGGVGETLASAARQASDVVRPAAKASEKEEVAP